MIRITVVLLTLLGLTAMQLNVNAQSPCAAPNCSPVPMTDVCSDGTNTVTLTCDATLSNVIWYNSSGVQVGTGCNLTVDNTLIGTGAVGQSECFYYEGDDSDTCPGESCCPVTVTVLNCMTCDVTADDASCNGEADGELSATVMNGVAPLSYLWSDGQTAATAVGLVAGTYMVTVTDAAGGSSVCSGTVSEPPLLTCSTSGTDVSCFGAADGMATVTVGGGTPIYSYLWDNGDTNATAVGLTAGLHTVTITDDQDCELICDVTIGTSANLVCSTTPTNLLCFEDNTGAIALAVVGGTTPYTYDWSNDGPETPDDDTQNISGLAAGIYSVTVTDANGCTTICTETVTEPSPLTCSVATSDETDCAAADGTLTVTPSGGTAPYTYSVNGGAFSTNATTTGLAAGSYTVTTQDANGCIVECVGIINTPEAPMCTLAGNNVTCFGGNDGTVVVSATGGSGNYVYSLDGGPFSNVDTYLGVAAGSYTVTVANVGNPSCTSVCNITITEPTQLVCVADATDATCNGALDGTASVTGSGGTPPYSYAWNTMPAQTTATAVMLSAGTWTAVVTDANGCTTNCTAVVTEPEEVTCSLVITNPLCNILNGIPDGEITVVPAGGTGPYEYSLNIGAFQMSPDFTGLEAGSYVVTTRDANGCIGNCTADLIEPEVLDCTTTSTDGTDCGVNDGTITTSAVGGTPPYAYSLNGAAFVNSGNFTGLSAGNYNIVTVDANGCEVQCFATVTSPNVPTCSIVAVTPVSCNGGADGTITAEGADGSGAFEYSLDGAVFQSSGTFASLSAGSYTVTVRNVGNPMCISTCTAVITEPTLIECSVATTDATCPSAADGTATVTPEGGTAPYTYLWSDGQTSDMAAGLVAGTYIVTVTDANGCQAICDGQVMEPMVLECTIVTTDVTCMGIADGTLTIGSTGGTPNYEYSLDGGAFQVGNVFMDLAIGSYIVTVRDMNGCLSNCSATIVEPTMLTCTVETTDASNCGVDDGTLTVTAIGGTPAYTYAVNGGAAQTSNVFSGLSAGTYTVDVVDANGCISTCSGTINAPSAPMCSIVETDITCSGGSDGVLDVTGTGGTGAYEFSLDGIVFQTSGMFTGLPDGSYTVTVRNVGQSNCISTCNALLIEPAPLMCTVTGTDPDCNGGMDGNAAVSHVGGTAPYSYSWSNGAITASIDGLVEGLYEVTVTDVNGCIAVCNTTLMAPPTVSCTLMAMDVSCINGNDGFVIVEGMGGVPAYEFSLMGGAFQSGNVFNALGAGTFTVTIRDANDCASSCSIEITEPPLLVCSVVATDATDCNIDDGTITVMATDGTPGYMYSLNGGAFQTSNVFTGLGTGAYAIITRDDNGCTVECAGVVNAPSAPMCSITNVVDVTCYVGAEGSFEVAASGGSGAYEYSFEGGPFTATTVYTGLTAGNYTVEIRNVGNAMCTSTCNVTIVEPSELTCLTSFTDASCPGAADGATAVTAAGGTAPYTYAWSDGQTTVTAVNLVAATYIVTVTDANGCEVICDATVNEPMPVSCDLVIVNSDCATMTPGSITVIGMGGTPNYEFSSDGGVTFQPSNVFNNIGPNNYTITIIDANGCLSTCTGTVASENCNFDLALIKTVSASTPGPYAAGDLVTFDITVLNQGTVDAFNININDYVPVGLILSDPNWVLTGSTASLVTAIATIPPTGQVIMPITFMIDPAFVGTSITNNAEIGSADDDMDPTNMPPMDIDSSPDSEDGTTPDPNNDDAADSMGGDDYDPETIVLEPILMSIGSTVFSDDNNNGIQDAGEDSLGSGSKAGKSVTLDLYDANTGALVATTTTDANGSYLFDNLLPGDYYIEFMPPATLPVSSTPTNTADDQVDGDDNGSQLDTNGDGLTDGVITSPVITLTPGSEPTNEPGTNGGKDAADDASGDMTVDFGLVPLGSIGSTVFFDANDNGVQDAGEDSLGSGVAAGKVVTLELYDSTTGALVATTTTDANGSYIFDNLLPGDYYIEFMPPASFPVSSTPTNTADDQVDGDDNGSQQDTNGDGITDGVITSPIISLTPGTEPVGEPGKNGGKDDVDDANGDMTVDFGLIGAPVYDLALTKQVVTPAPYSLGQDVTYNIMVCNQGTVDANTFEITDHIPTGMSLSTTAGTNAGWIGGPTGNVTYTYNGLLAATDPDACTAIAITLTIDPTFMGTSLVNNAEITADDGDDVDSDPSVFAMLDDFADDNLLTETDGGDDEDPEVISVGQTYDLALVKQVVTPDPYMAGQDVTYAILVCNQGTIDANFFEITDHIPAGMSLSTAAGTNMGWVGGPTGSVTYASSTLIPAANPDACTTVNITLTIDPSFMGTSLVNEAEITDDDGDDIDSDPSIDDGPDTDNSMTDGADDEDPEEILVQPMLMSIGSTVFSDDNNNGIQDAGEDSLGSGSKAGKSVTLDLYDANTGALVATTTTDANGSYLFDNLLPGDYYIEFMPPASLPVSSTPTNTADDQVDGDDNGSQVDTNGDGLTDGVITSPVITLSPGTEPTNEPETNGGKDAGNDANGDMTIDFGLVPLGSIGSTVFSDDNNNGIQDAGEDSIGSGSKAGKVVTLELYDAVTGALVATTTTDANGSYLFDNLLPGDYYIEFMPPATLPVSSTPTNTADDQVDGDDNGSQLDTNGDGLTDGVITSPVITLTPGSEPTNEPGTNGGKDAADDASGDMTVDFGLVPLGSIGSTVFFDANDNGVQDAGEDSLGSGVAAGKVVTLELYDSTTGALVATSTTDANGSYIFDNLLPGDYYIEFMPPASFPVSSTPTNTADDQVDGDDNGSQQDTNGDGITDGVITSPIISLTPGTEPVGEPGKNGGKDDVDDANGDMTVDFGLIGAPVYDLALTKQVVTPAPYSLGQDVTYNIMVCNQGTVDANTFEITDHIPTGMSLSTTAGTNAGWIGGPTGNVTYTYNGLLAATDPDACTAIAITLTIDPTFMGTSLVNNAEITADDGDDVDSDPSVFAMLDDFADDNLLTETDGGDDEDPEVISVGQTYDLALVKQVVTPDPYMAGQDVTYAILVCNQGTIDANFFEITDHIPAGMSLSTAAGTNMGWVGGPTGSVTYASSTLIPAANPDACTTVNITLTIDPSFMGTSLVNEAEITDDDGDDIDSDPSIDDGPDTDNSMTDGADDEDPEEILVQPMLMSIGSTVFSDDNNNGIQDTGEDSIGSGSKAGKSVTLDLYDANTGALVATTTTDANGSYLFDNLLPGDYYIEFMPPASLPVSSTPTNTADDQVDGDDNGSQVDTNGDGLTDGVITSPVITLSPGTEPTNEPETNGGKDAGNDANGDMTIDFGLVPLGSIGSTVFSDDNNNGIQDAGEDSLGSGVAAGKVVTLELYDSTTGALVATTTTDANGSYIFDNLLPGDYYIEFMPPASFPVSSTPTNTADDQVDGDDNGSQQDTNGDGITDGVITSPIISLTPGTEPVGEPGKNGGKDAANDANGDMTVDFGLIGAPVFDLALDKVYSSYSDLDGDGAISPGDNVVFTINVYNQGTVDATSVEITDYVPADLIYNPSSILNVANGWGAGPDPTTNIGALPSGNGLAAVQIELMIDPAFAGLSIVNDSEITDATNALGIADEDSTPSNNVTPDDLANDNDIADVTGGDDQDPAEILVNQPAPIFDMALTKVLTSPGPHMPGDVISFELTVINQGDVAATNTVVTDNSPAGLIFQSSTADPNVVENGNETFTVTSLPAMSSQIIEVFYMISPSSTATSMINDAEISSASGNDVDSTPGDNATPDDLANDNDTADTTGGDDQDPAEITIVQPTPIFDLALTKVLTSTGPHMLGDVISFELTVINQGDVAATNTVVTDNSPAGLIYQGSTAHANVVDNGNETFTITSLPAMTNQVIEVFYLISPSTTATSMINDAEITSASGNDVDSTPGDNVTPDDLANDNDTADTNGGDDQDPAEVLIIQPTPVFDLALTKQLSTATPGPFMTGSTVTYDIAVFNQGNVDAFNVNVNDYIPSGLTLVDAAWTNVGGVASLVSPIGTIAAGTTQTVTISFVIDANFMGSSITNNAEISEADDDTDPNNGAPTDADSTPGSENGTNVDPNDNDITDTTGGDDYDPETIFLIQEFDLALEKVYDSFTDNNGDGVISAGDNVLFTITVFNQGNIAATNVEVTDYVPADLIYDNSSLVNVANGWGLGPNPIVNLGALGTGSGSAASTSVQIELLIDPAFMGTSIVNDAEITTATNAAGIADEDSTPGDNAVSASELGSDNNVDDEAPGTPGIMDDPNDEDDFDPAEITVGQTFDLALIKGVNASTPGPYAPGSTVTYDISVINQGSVDAFNVNVNDYIPTGLTLTDAAWVDLGGVATMATPLASLPVGMTSTVTITFTIDNNFMGTSITNNAEISDADDDADPTNGTPTDVDSTPGSEDGTNPDPNDNDLLDSTGGDDYDPETITIDQVYDLALIKTLAAGQSAAVAPGDAVDFTITVYNQGTINADNIEITDYIPNGFTYNPASNAGWIDNLDGTTTTTLSTANGSIPAGGLVPGGSVNVTITLDVAHNAPQGQDLINYAEISGDDGDDADSTSDNDPSNDSFGGDDVTDNSDDDEDDSDLATVSIVEFDLALIKSLAANQSATVATGDLVSYDITVTNQGDISADNILIVDHIPSCMTAADANWTGTDPIYYTASVANGDLPLGGLLPGAAVTVSLTLAIDSDATLSCDLTNTAEIVDATDEDGDPISDVDSTPDDTFGNDTFGGDDVIDGTGGDEDDSDIAEVALNLPYDLALTKKYTDFIDFNGDGSISQEDDVIFTITVENQGMLDASNIEVTDYIPSGMFLSPNDTNNWIGSINGPVTNTIASITANGGIASLQIILRVDPTFMGTELINWAEISNDDGLDVDSTPDDIQFNGTGETDDLTDDGVTDNSNGDEDDHDPAVITVGQRFDLALMKSVVPGQTGPFEVYDDITYAITVFNQGTLDAYNVQVIDYVQAGQVLSPNDTNGWAQDANGNYTNIVPGIIRPGDQAEVYITMRVTPQVYALQLDSLSNIAEIFSATDVDGNVQDDDDSTADTSFGNDLQMDDVTDNTGGDEDDEDLAFVMLEPLDPTGYIYCDKTGEIITGGTVSVSGPGVITYGIDADGNVLNGLDGSYQFFVDTPGVYEITYTHPLGYPISTRCEALPGVFDPTFADGGIFDRDMIVDNTIVMGSDTLGGYLVDFDCASNNFFTAVDLQPADPPIIEFNNIPVACILVQSTVCNDTNLNGIGEPSDPGFDGITVSLFRCNDLTTPVSTTVTENGGQYNFSGLEAGCYRLFFDVPNGYSVIDNPNINADGFSNEFTVFYGDCYTDGEVCLTMATSGLGNFVWHDLDGDGIQDFGEPGLADVRVELFNDNGVLLDIQYTDFMGQYLFDGLNPGHYYVKFETPDGFSLTGANSGNNDNEDSDVDNSNGSGTTSNVWLDAGELDLSWDAGYYQCVPIGDFLWNDDNGNGRQDSAENGINGVKVNLWRVVNGTRFLHDYQYTRHKPGTPSDDGYFCFCAPPGTYHLEYEINNSLFTVTNAGQGNSTGDSDITGANGPNTTGNFTVLSGEDHKDKDGGYRYVGPLSQDPISGAVLDVNDNEIDYSAHIKGDANEACNTISWTIDNEPVVGYYLIERKTDNGLYESVGRVMTSEEYTSQYEYVDYDVDEAIFDYKVTLVGEASTFEVGEIALDRVVNVTEVKLYPTVTTSYATLRVSTEISTEIQVAIVSVAGEMIQSDLISESIDAGITEYRINASGLTPGIYTLRVLIGQEISTQKLIVLAN